jgi:hypothetical protein
VAQEQLQQSRRQLCRSDGTRGRLDVRQAIFGEGNGLLSFHVDDAIELIRIFDIAWIG